MLYYCLMFRSVTFAQRAVRKLENNGIKAMSMRAPYSLSADGCGYCVKVPEPGFERAMIVLRDTEYAPGKVYRSAGQSGYEEVAERDLPG